MACIVFAFCAAAAVALPAQTFTILTSFNSTGGYNPNPTLVQGFNGNFYGTTYVSDEGNGLGTVFEITASGKMGALNSFNYNNGAQPMVGLVQAANGDLYGTTSYGGTNAAGTVFEVTPAGTLTTLYNFCSIGVCADGYGGAGLVQASNGNFYGTTLIGGADGNDDGTVFEITPAGVLTTLHSFDGTDGSSPQGLVQAANGNFYGTAGGGGANGGGTIFEITPAGTLTTLYNFCSLELCADGRNPVTLLQASDGNFYGTSRNGGFGNTTNCQFIDGCGTVFELTPAGTLTTLHKFDFNVGSQPNALVQATDGNFYGIAGGGGIGNVGMIFKITSAGTFTTLHTFDFNDGAYPNALMQATDGSFYGTTGAGGSNAVGVAFSLSVGLGPFVETLPTAAEVGAKVIILGNNLTGTTSVSFNGTAATFAVVSNTEIKATVPTGATTGAVEVTTPSGTLNSNVLFQVTP
jgi:uncharacterized repeat protein (TIGR03803 family)